MTERASEPTAAVDLEAGAALDVAELGRLGASARRNGGQRPPYFLFAVRFRFAFGRSSINSSRSAGVTSRAQHIFSSVASVAL